jgi:hypothetical protein
MRVEVFRGGETLVFELALAAPSEPIDPIRLLDELIEGNVLPLMAGAPRRESEPS